MTTIYVSDPVHDDVLTELRELGEIHLGYGPAAVTYQQVQHTVDAVLLRGEVFDREKITNSPRLKIIARHGVGFDNVDLDAASDADVWVTTTPGRNSRAVAEHVFALTLALARKIPTAAGRTRTGSWSESKAELTGFELPAARSACSAWAASDPWSCRSPAGSACASWSPTRSSMGSPRRRGADGAADEEPDRGVR